MVYILCLHFMMGNAQHLEMHKSCFGKLVMVVSDTENDSFYSIYSMTQTQWFHVNVCISSVYNSFSVKYISFKLVAI